MRETNRYAQQWIAGHQEYLQVHRHSRVHAWIREGETTPEEIRAFLGVVFNMGLIKKNKYWILLGHNESQSTPWFPEHFNRNSFQLLLKFLHFADNNNMPPPEHEDHKTYKAQAIIDIIKHKFQRF